MQTITTDKYIIYKGENTFSNYNSKLQEAFNTPVAQNIILDLTSIETTEEQVKSLEVFANIQNEQHKSFVIILPTFDSDVFPEKLNVVPTLIEAEDIIDMDEMTRDLGF